MYRHSSVYRTPSALRHQRQRWQDAVNDKRRRRWVRQRLADRLRHRGTSTETSWGDALIPGEDATLLHGGQRSRPRTESYQQVLTAGRPTVDSPSWHCRGICHRNAKPITCHQSFTQWCTSKAWITLNDFVIQKLLMLQISQIIIIIIIIISHLYSAYYRKKEHRC